MTRRLIAAAALSSLIAGCSIPQLAATATRASLSPETVTTLTGICRNGVQLVEIAAQPAMPAQVQDIGKYVGAYCGQLLAGTVPPTTDANTVNWLPQNLAGLRNSLPFNL